MPLTTFLFEAIWRDVLENILDMPGPVPTTAPDDENVPAELVRALLAYHGKSALHDRDHRLSYGDLASFVLVFQSQLTGDGPVAIYGTPSTLLAAAAVACVISGRPFVHLDPAMPQTVLTNIIAELEVGIIVTCQPARPGLLPDDCHIIAAQTCLDRDPPAAGKPLVAANVRPTDIIYLVATSGTTGRPKCIPVTHDAAYLSYQWRDTYTPYDATMKVGIYIFAIWEMFRPLRKGADLFFPGLNDLMSPKALVAFLSERGIDEILFTPSFFEKTLSAIDPEVGASLPLSRVVLNGEVVNDSLIAEARNKLPNTALWNLYSICETHDISITRLTGAADPTEGVSVGVAMPYLRAVVLDENDQHCPAGQPGLLHFEGPRMLGPGYINRPDETAQRFRSLAAGGRERRLYDTGDQGYVTEDGQIYVLGRVAHMLKLRGHSIQTRELTGTLAAHIGFAQAIPWVQQIDGQGQALVFYYTADAAQLARNAERWNITSQWRRTPRALAEALREGLPHYCIPTYLVHLDEIPINQVSGKCDFKALPAVPLADTTQESDADVLPVTRLAARIMGCPVGSIDPALSFHDQGGDSLMCVDLLMLLESAYGHRVDFDWALNVPLARLHSLLTAQASPARQQGAFQQKGILLTGATGFLGGHVLAEAANHLPQDQVIYCLVRPRNNDPMSRLATKAKALGVPEDRFVVVAGSIEDTRFGLDQEAYDGLAEKVSAVIHCAAMVNLAVGRELMEAWSQSGISTILQFCEDAGAPLGFSSSTSVFPDTGGPYSEDATTVFDGVSGYGAAKIAAEHAIAGSGVAATIVRLPSLYDLNDPNPNDIYETILKSCQELGSVPLGMCFNMTDVRAAAKFLVRQAQSERVSYCNLIADSAVTCPPSAVGLEPVSASTWLATAPLTPAERRLISESPTILCADAVYENTTAKRTWDQVGLGPFQLVSDVDALLTRRLPRSQKAAEPAATRATRR
jgi:acyl-coenzyme A synthetase/AMP-(fatty) acid ligase/thioester reductase-like protein/acyl carrier protein